MPSRNGTSTLPRRSRVNNETASANAWTHLGVRVQQTNVGRGVFADRTFIADELVAELPGRIIDDADYRSAYCIDLGGNFSLEPDAPFSFLNHACSPNCELHCVDAENEAGAAIELVTIRPIAIGEELTIDYAWPAESAIRCGCNSEQCRGWVVDAEQLDQVDTEEVDTEDA